MYFLFSPALCSRYTPTRQYFTRVRQSATRESNSDACREMGSHLSKGIRMGEQHPVISLPLGLGDGMDAESGDRRGKGIEEGASAPLSLLLYLKLNVLHPLALKPPKITCIFSPWSRSVVWVPFILCFLCSIRSETLHSLKNP